TDCIACHDTDFNGVADPNHVTNNFPTDCLVCHTTAGWLPATFDHSQTQFQLTGAHAPLDCNSCHQDGFDGTPTDCIACHDTDFNGVADPNHVTNNFPTDCLVCHTTAGWLPTTFDHNQTPFPLTGAHAPLDCNACHQDGFDGTPTDCMACHDTDFNGVADPNHVTNNFPTDCLACHTTAGWLPTTFDHNQTPFPLTGAHAPLDCNACHQDGFDGTPTDCMACH
ncbi:MAG: hypothetical protein GY788_25175, partial [bacterium]|nr:hypothetical protein [bacterium]